MKSNYKAIQDSTKATDSGIFVEFMLDEILTTLKSRQGEPLELKSNVGANVGANKVAEQIISLIKQQPGINASTITAIIGDKTKRTIERSLSDLKAKGLIEFRGTAKNGGVLLDK